MENKDLFQVASRKKYRFETVRGQVTVEDLWDMPLLSRDDFNLDVVAKAINAKIKASEDESFVKIKTTANEDLQNRLDIVKYVIATKLEETKERETAAVKAQEKAKLTELLARKQDAALENLTPEEIQAKIDALNA